MSKTFEERLQEAVYIKQSKNMFNKNTVIEDAYLDNAGEIIVGTSNYWVISNYIAVKAGAVYNYHGLTNIGEAPYSAYYDKNKQLISTFKQATETNILTIPNDVCFIRFSINKNANDMNTFQFEQGNVATSYINGSDRILLNSSGEEILNVEELQKLEYRENWQTLTAGITYRRIGNDVELSLRASKEINENICSINANEIKHVGVLSTAYRPPQNVAIPIFRL